MSEDPAKSPVARLRPHGFAVAATAVLIAVAYSVYELTVYRTYRSSTYDLVIFDQAVRSYSHLHLPVAIVKGVHNGFGPHFNVLGDHFSPIIAVLAPLYWIHGGPQTLLVAQSVLLAAAVVPLWVFARRAAGVFAAYCVVAIYAVSWPVASAVAFDFHETAFVPLLTAVLLERYQAGRRIPALIAAFGLLLVKEDVGLLVAGFGLFLATGCRLPAQQKYQRQRLLGAALVIGGVGWTLVASHMFIPAFGGRANYYWAYTALGPDMPSAAAHAFAHPMATIRLFGTPSIKLTTMTWLLVPLLLLPLASPLTLMVVLPVAARMASNVFPNWWGEAYQYNVELIVALAAAGLDGALRIGALLARIRRDDSGSEQVATVPRMTAIASKRIAPAWAVAALAVSVATIPEFAFDAYGHSSFYRRTPADAAAAAATSHVPGGVVVEAASLIGPHLSARDTVLLLDKTPRWAPWVVAQTADVTFPISDVTAQRARVAYLETSGYHVVWQDDFYVVLNKQGSLPVYNGGNG